MATFNQELLIPKHLPKIIACVNCRTPTSCRKEEDFSTNADWVWCGSLGSLASLRAPGRGEAPHGRQVEGFYLNKPSKTAAA
jgi:hypothetical protein